MPKKHYKSEEIINILRKIGILVSQGQTAQMAARGVGISEQTYYRWRKEYGGMRTDQTQMLKELELENSRLKRIVADPLHFEDVIKRIYSYGVFIRGLFLFSFLNT